MSHKTAMFVGACALLSACHNGDNLHPDGQPQADAPHHIDASDDAPPRCAAGLSRRQRRACRASPG